MTAVGCALLVFLGIKYLMRAVGLSFRAHVQTQSDTTPPPSDRLASSNFEGILHDRSAPARSRLLSAPFFQSFGLAVLNPMLLFFLFTNATLFSSQFPGRVTEVHIVFLFAGTLVGTAAWYAGFGEILWRRAGTWNTRNRALAEGLSGVLLVAAAISLCMKTIF
jgi:threonine/homoserine/homoserine lactone efflux protein